MADACRKEISAWWDQNRTASNAGLLRDRYLRVAVKDKENHLGARKNLFAAMCQSIAQSEAIYKAVCKRQETAFKDLKSRGLFKTTGRLIIGLGGENVLETGLTLHHTYGTPVIPGTAFKGLASHYCNQTWGVVDDRFKLEGEYHQTIFGTTEDSGHVIFHDAWITPETLETSLQPDVMTPHHGDYYSDESGNSPPTDFDDPNPVTFLSVVGTFYVAVSCDVPGEEGQKWAKLAFDLLSEALKEWGIGGKTNAGYGRLVPVNSNETNDQPSVKIADSKIAPLSPDVREQQKQVPSAAKRLKYKKGDIVEVTKAADPNEKRGEAYFMADDGIGGRVVLGTLPSIQIGEKARLEINGVMEKEGLYNFAAVGAKREPARQTRGKRGRR